MFKILVILCALVSYSESKPREVGCPDYCDFDIFKNLFRATCMYKKIETIQIDMLPQVEILNLGFNQIVKIDNYVFKDMGSTNLKLLNLTHNKIEILELNSFEGLSKLKSLDLSYNAITNFMGFWFNSTSSLQELYLKGNNLTTFNPEARITLNYLQVLDISSCQITSFSSKTFKYIPNLKFLDISGNDLTTLNPRMIHPLKELKVFAVEDNNFDCNNKMREVKNYTINKNITYYDPCLAHINNSESGQFKSMMVEPERFEKNVWMFEDVDANVSTVINDVKIYCKSSNNATIASIFMEVIILSPMLSVIIILITGIFLGLILGCTIEIIPNPRNKTTENIQGESVSLDSFASQNSSPFSQRSNTRANTLTGMKRLSRSMKRLSRSMGFNRKPGEYGEAFMMSQFHLPDSTPMVQRRDYNNGISEPKPIIYANLQPAQAFVPT